MNEPPAEDRLFRYLLGDALTDAEQDDIEECYFKDDSYFERVLAAEDDLIDRRLRGALSDGERVLFEKNFLASARRHAKWQARDTLALHGRGASAQTSIATSFSGFLGSLAPSSRMLLAASSLAFVACVGLLGWRYLDLRKQTSALQSRLEAIERRTTGPVDVAEFALESERFRSGSADPLRVSASARWIVLRVKLPALYSGYSSFGATLSTAEGAEIWTQKGLAPTASSIEIDLPALALRRGDYVLSLSAVGGNAEVKLPAYQFRVDRG